MVQEPTELGHLSPGREGRAALDLHAAIELFRTVLAADWRTRKDTFCAAFPGPLPLIEQCRADGKVVQQLVALHTDEVPTLVTLLFEPNSGWLGPSMPTKWTVRVLEITAEELTESSKKPGERATWGTEKDVWRKLIDRLEHLGSLDLGSVTGWVWEGQRPYPLIAGGLRYFVRESEYSSRKDDRWVDFPLRGDAEHDAYHGGFAFKPPQRLALTHQNGRMQAFDVDHGFLGPNGFVWLRKLHTAPDARAGFEGVREGDLAPETARVILPDHSWPLVMRSHVYGPGPQPGSLARLTPRGLSLLPGYAKCPSGAAHVISLLAHEDETFTGPWRAAIDGTDSFGPEVDQVNVHWWGFGLHDRDNPGRWWIMPRGSGRFAALQLDAMPDIGPLMEILIGSIDGQFGALDIHTGQEIIPFVHPEWQELMFSPEHAVVFVDAEGLFSAYDEFGARLVGPLRLFELDKTLWPSWKRPFGPEGKSDDEKRMLYIRHDIGEMVRSARRLKRFGDLDSLAPTLAAYAGRLTEGRKDADLCGLWGASVEIAEHIEAYGTILIRGQRGRIGFGDVAPYGGSSMFNWLVELPVEGLLEGGSAKVIGVPFGALRIVRRRS